MKKIFGVLAILCGLAVSACDLQPKITSLPDSVGDFISTRYPALLADPETEPEIYNSAVTDYGVYASPELYGSAGVDDYMMYASVDDYTLPATHDKPAQTPIYGGEPLVAQTPAPDATVDDYLMVPVYDASAHAQLEQVEIIVQKGDTLYSLSRKYSLSVEDLAKLNNLSAPYALAVGQKLKVAKPKELITVETKAEIKGEPVKAELIDVTVGAGDTLYSISRKFSVPVNELAVTNKLSPPFTLSIGQNLKVPVAVVAKTPAATPVSAPARSATTPTKPAAAPAKTSTPNIAKPAAKPAATTAAPKISSDPSKKLPTISARSSSKFSWPVRGTILSSFGAKSNGLFNDGINISAKAGVKVSAAENGVVAYAGNEVKGMGNLVIVQHSDGWMTVYAHMDKMSVRRGTKVTVGQQVGTVGQTGKVDKPQLHFEIRKGTKAYDPSAYLKK